MNYKTKTQIKNRFVGFQHTLLTVDTSEFGRYFSKHHKSKVKDESLSKPERVS